MIRFQCPHCAQKLAVPDGQAGRASQCPGCNNRITIPPRAAASLTAISDELLVAPVDPADADRARALQASQGESTAAPSDAMDPRLLHVPPAQAARKDGLDALLREKEVPVKLGFKPPPEYTGERRLPWPIDILLYPANTSGLTTLAIIVGIPFLLILVQRVFFLPFLGLPLSLARLAVALYAAWYGAECVHDSARGGTRVPEIIGDTPAWGDMWSRVSYLLAVYIVFVLPLVLCPLYGSRDPIVLGVLGGWAIVFFPMGLLAMVINDGVYVLNPLFLLGSIWRTFFPYVGLLILIAAQVALFRLVPTLLRRGEYSLWSAGFGSFVAGYWSLVTAHLLGRFYWRYRQRLDWGL